MFHCSKTYDSPTLTTRLKVIVADLISLMEKSLSKSEKPWVKNYEKTPNSYVVFIT